MIMSIYKSLGGLVGGLIVFNNLDIVKVLDVIVFLGMMVNFDVVKIVVFVVIMIDWCDFGCVYVKEMIVMFWVLVVGFDV